MATDKSENQVFWDFGEANWGFEPLERQGVRRAYHKTKGREGLTTEEGLSLETTEAALGIIPEF